MRKSLLKTLIILSIVMLMCIGCVQAAVTSGYTFGISPYRVDASGNKFVHTFETSDGLKYIWNVQMYNNGIADTEEVFYCLAQGYGDFGNFASTATVGQVPNTTGGTSPSSYSGPYRLKDTGVQATLNSLYTGTEVTAFTEPTYKGLLWIFDNMYIPEEDRIEFLEKIPCTDDAFLGFTDMTDFTVASVIDVSESTEDDITEIDIQIAQQLAMWALTNPETVSSFPTIYLSENDSVLKTYLSLYPGEDPNTGMGYGRLKEYCIKMIYNYLVKGAQAAITNGYTGDNITTVSVYANAAAQPVVTVTREKELVGQYDIVIKKVDEKGNPLQGAVFTVGGTDYTTAADGTVIIADDIAITETNVGTNDTYSIVEKSVPAGYIKYEGTIGLTVSKKEATDGLSYVLDKATLDSTSTASGKVTINHDTNTITITVENESVKGDYAVRINKQNEEGDVLQGAIFNVNGTEYTTDADGFATIASNVEINRDNVTTKDTYTMEEIKAPDGYLLYDGTIVVEVTKKFDGQNYVIDTVTLDETSQASGMVSVVVEGNTITVIIVEERIEGAYTVRINKQNEEGEVLQGAVFDVNGTEYTTDRDGFATIAANVEITQDNVNVKDTYTLEEIIAPTGYLLYDGTIVLEVTKKQDGDTYVLDTVTLDETSQSSGMVRVEIDGNTITVIIIEERIQGAYSVRINKQNQKGEVLQGAVFTVNGTNYTTDQDGYATIVNNLEINEDNVNVKDTYSMEEIQAPTGYVVYDGEITLEVTKKLDGENYVLDQVTIDETSEASGKVRVEIDTRTNTITVIIIEDNIDLALRKFISKVVDQEGNEVYSEADLVARVPEADETKLKEGTDTTGEYNHTKQPVRVSVGDKVTYTLRVYNEGESDAYITEITDYLPEYLEYVENGEWIRTYGVEGDKFASKATTELATVTGASNNLQSQIGKVLKEGILLPAYDKVNDVVSYVDVKITCEVLQPEIADVEILEYKMTNIAEITGMLDRDKNEVAQDIDSTPDNVNLPETEGDWVDYKDEEIGEKDYIPGQEDDDDFEKVVIVLPKYDLALRKFIVAVNEKNLVDANGKYLREPVVDVSTLQQGIEEQGFGTATYNHPKVPVEVKRGNIVTYVIRVYNEGNVDAYVSEITDTLPEYLEYLADDELNKEYGWTYDEATREIKTTITARNNEKAKLLLAYAGGDVLDCIDVKVRCKVVESTPAETKVTNIAEITDMTAPNGDEVEDVDSKPDENLEIPEDLPGYREDEENNDYVPGQEDDDDFDKVIVEGDFDLALRKFITKVNNTDINNRYPQLSIDENGNIKYTHTKEPVEVCYQDTVIYTIRIYNEGEVDGYANEITDDVPEGLEFIVDNEINKAYRWVMLDENEQVTQDVTKAKYLVTDYLSEEQENETGRNNLIKAFDKEAGLSDTNPNHRDVQIAFKVTYQITSLDEESRILVNVAQISEDSDDDIDSDPNRDEEYDDDDHEDDIDYDNVKVKYFDLALRKWVTQAIVIENGETTIFDTGHKAEDDPEQVVKVEIKSKDVNKVIVKFAYKIRITNEGEIAGYATEITDHIPEGLKFLPEDNPEWYVRRDGVVATDQLKDVLLQPGESAEVEIVLTWINGEDNLGLKVNVAEISQDDNPSDTPDIDSTPDNEVPEEDDIDDAPVMLVIKTGLGIELQYIILGFIVMTILISGTVAIKKFVL